MGDGNVVLHAVRGAAASLRSEEEGVKGEGPLKGRATLRWQELPIIAATVACILGLALSIIWEYNAYAVIFGIGSVGSIYTFYQARISFVYKTENAKHQAENKKQARIVDAQAGQLRRLKTAVGDHEENNRAQSAITKLLGELHDRAKVDLEGFLHSLSGELGELKGETSGVSRLAGVLQGVIDTLSENLNVEKLQELQTKQSEETGRLETLRELSQVQLEDMDKLRMSLHETFMGILKAGRDEVKANAPGNSEQIDKAFELYGTRVSSMLQALPAAVEVKA